MAIVDGKFLRGVTGNTVLRKYRGKQVFGMKSMMTKQNMTKASLKAAKTFGIASVLAKHMRNALDNLIMGLYDGTMIYRLNTDTLYCLNGAKNPETQEFNLQPESFDRLKGFDFNADSPFKNSLIAQPEVIHTDATIQVILPEMSIRQDIRFPKDTVNCRVVVTVVALDLTQGKYKTLPEQSVQIDYGTGTGVFPGHTFEFAAEPGCLCITAASLQFFRKTPNSSRCINTKDFSPTTILDAYLFDGLANSEDIHSWENFRSKKLVWKNAVKIMA